MRIPVRHLAAFGLVCSGLLGLAAAQEEAKDLAKDAPKPAYLDTSLPPEQRAADLVQRMTLEEIGRASCRERVSECV